MKIDPDSQFFFLLSLFRTAQKGLNTEVQYENMIKFDNPVISNNHAHMAIKGEAKTVRQMI